jgi:hypothetical protein
MADINFGADDVVKILGVGIAGLSFLLAVLAFWLLQKEQEKKLPDRSILRAIYVFEGFALCLSVISLASELYRWNHDDKVTGLQRDLGTANGTVKSDEVKITELTSEVQGHEKLKQDFEDLGKKLTAAEADKNTLDEQIKLLKGQKQSWLKIHTVDGLPDTPLRVFMIINNVTYSYPVTSIWIEGGEGQELPEIEFPVAIQSENLTLRFFVLAQDRGGEQRFESSQVIEHSATWEGREYYDVFEISGSVKNVHPITRITRNRVRINYEITRR